MVKGDVIIPVAFVCIEGVCGKVDIEGMHVDFKKVESNFANSLLKDVARATSAAYPFFTAATICG